MGTHWDLNREIAEGNARNRAEFIAEYGLTVVQRVDAAEDAIRRGDLDYAWMYWQSARDWLGDRPEPGVMHNIRAYLERAEASGALSQQRACGAASLRVERVDP